MGSELTHVRRGNRGLVLDKNNLIKNDSESPEEGRYAVSELYGAHTAVSGPSVPLELWAPLDSQHKVLN